MIILPPQICIAATRIVCLACLMLAACSQPIAHNVTTMSAGGPTMGTSWSALWVDEPDVANWPDTLTVQSTLEAELARINALMSTWDPDSRLSKFNASSSIEPQAMHANTLTVIDTALAISRLSQGSYDITLQPVIELWGFGKDTHLPTPAEAEIAAALKLSGHLQLVRIGNTVRKRQAGVAIDVSSLAKGYAVDKLGELMESLGVRRYLVEIGGELRARGLREDNQLWRVGVENPQGDVPQVIALHNAHIASSGSYRNYRVENGKRLSHIIDGATGRPIEHDLVSVSVVHDSTMSADAWATALLVVGEERARKLIEQQGLVAQLTMVREGEFVQEATPGFSAMLVPAE